jgi:hypothetical protein
MKTIRKLLFIFFALVPLPAAAAKICAAPTGTVRAIYPVGAIYISTNGANPASLFGFGTWEQYSQGRVMIGAGTGSDSRGEARHFPIGGTDGEYNHVLSIAEMPAHTHGSYARQRGQWASNVGKLDSSDSSYGNATADARFNQYEGGSQPHNNMPPYMTVYIWRRTA